VNETRNNEDTHLLQRIAHRDRQAFSRFYDRYAGVLHSTAARILRNPEDAAACAEGVFLQIWEQARAYSASEGQPFHWALALTRKNAIARMRAANRRYGFVEEFTLETAAGANQRGIDENEFPGREQTRRIRAAVESLPLEQRQAIEMAFLGGLTQNEIAEALHQPAATIKTRIRRGMLVLHEFLKNKP